MLDSSYSYSKFLTYMAISQTGMYIRRGMAIASAGSVGLGS